MKVLIDHMNFTFISYSMALRELKNKGEELTRDNVGFLYHTLINKYNFLFKNYGQAIICHEGRGSLDWRRSIFPDYKRNRDAGKSEPHFKIIKETFPLVEELLCSYPCKQVKVDGCEADDVIYKLARYYAEEMNEEVVIISTDGDLSQILDYSDNITLYNPIKRVFCEKRPNIIKMKAVVGDRSDNIPGLHRVGEKTFEKMLEDDALFNEKLKGDNKKIYEDFLKIVDLSKVPEKFQAEILRKEKEEKYSLFDPGKIEYFMFENGLQEHISRWGSVSGDIIEKLVSLGIEVKTQFQEVEKTKNSKDKDLDDFLKEYI